MAVTPVRYNRRMALSERAIISAVTARLSLLMVATACMSCTSDVDVDKALAVELVGETIYNIESWSERPGRIVDLIEDGREIRSESSKLRTRLADMKLSDETKVALRAILADCEESVTQKSLSLTAQLQFGAEGSAIVATFVHAEQFDYWLSGTIFFDGNYLRKSATDDEKFKTSRRP